MPLWKRTDLTDIRLVANHMTRLHPKLLNFTNLTSLVLRHNDLDELPDKLERFSKLVSLVLEGNQLTSLPRSFESLRNITVCARWHTTDCASACLPVQR